MYFTNSWFKATNSLMKCLSVIYRVQGKLKLDRRLHGSKPDMYNLQGSRAAARCLAGQGALGGARGARLCWWGLPLWAPSGPFVPPSSFHHGNGWWKPGQGVGRVSHEWRQDLMTECDKKHTAKFPFSQTVFQMERLSVIQLQYF